MVILYVGNILSKHGKTPTNIETLGPQLESLGYQQIYTSDKRNIILRLLHMVFVLVKNFRKIDKVLIDLYSTRSFWYAILLGELCRILSIPYYPILHGGDLPKRLLKNPKFCGRFLQGSASIVAPSAYLKGIFEEAGFSVKHIPNNICISNYKYHNRFPFCPRLLYVRSFDAVYNPQMAIEVLSLLKVKFPEAQLCMVGPDKDGSMKQCIDRVAELGLADSVLFTGRLEKSEWHQLSRDYDIFINTTNFDNTPVSVIEAMALGLPVVSTNVGGIPYLLEDGVDSILVERGDAHQMVSAIERLLDDKHLADAIASNARKKAEGFDWEVVKEKWTRLLN